MPLQSSGAISLNDMHVEVGGTSGTQCSMNDSDIRGLIGKASGAQSSFSQFYGASSSLWSPNITVAYWTFKSIQYIGYGQDVLGNQQGSSNDNTVDFINNGNASLDVLMSMWNGSSWSFIFTAGNVGTDTGNSGFTSLTVNNNTLLRTNASTFQYVPTTSTKQWNWATSSNLMGTTTAGTVRSVVFS